ncbi:MAG: hypothetical protein HZB92_07185 [Euryarchaeota archaeon]|nr:hypothetical protein [Euryarchaeota archaeon]
MAIEEQLFRLSPVTRSVIQHQISELGISKDFMTPKQADALVKRVTSALTLFLGPSGAEQAKGIMLRELRKRAPDHFASMGL